ncbi:MAG: LysM domain [Clostridia bacterium]|jgi:spore germination protein YaaH|nr:LysM domain [Clostridia bacterium]
MAKQKLKLYYVEGGDTLYKIAKRFNTTVEEIMKYNRPWVSRLSSGLKLWVPDNRIGTETSSVVDDRRSLNEAQTEETDLRISTSEIISFDISPRKIFYMENTMQDYITIKLKTAVPTRGDIIVTGNSQTAKIVLSEEYKNEHLVFWAPLHEKTKKPLPPGEYTLSLNLYKKNLQK